MKIKKIYWQDAIRLIKEGKTVEQKEIDYRNEKILVKEVTFLNKNGLRVPQKLVFYDDKNIDYSDIPAITDDDIKSGKIQWISADEFPIDAEVRRWIVQQNINLSDLIGNLINNFYHTMKNVQKNAAI
ncbi:MAG: hypothetical protein HY958_06950 [Bacteroidia bacterium]|nr:hypothetical protein [Bacteroidia bacterium]